MSRRKYLYTQSNFALSDLQREFYEDNGYIVIKNLVDHELLDEIKQRFQDICNGNFSGDPLIGKVRDPSLKSKDIPGEYKINKLNDINFDDVMFKYAAHKGVVDVVESIIGPDITVANSMLINKPPNSIPQLSHHPLHQDLYYMPFRPKNLIVGTWTAMEKVHKDNGCLYFVPGSHKGELYPHKYPKGPTTHVYHEIVGLNVEKMYLPMEKGDTVFFHPALLHGSGPNITKGFRKAISCHYANSNCYFIDVRGTLQENMAKEIEHTAERRTGLKLNIGEVYKFKSKLIRGDPGNFKLSSNL